MFLPEYLSTTLRTPLLQRWGRAGMLWMMGLVFAVSLSGCADNYAFVTGSGSRTWKIIQVDVDGVADPQLAALRATSRLTFRVDRTFEAVLFYTQGVSEGNYEFTDNDTKFVVRIAGRADQVYQVVSIDDRSFVFYEINPSNSTRIQYTCKPA